MDYGVRSRVDPDTRIVPASDATSRIGSPAAQEPRALSRITDAYIENLVADQITAAFGSFDVLTALQGQIAYLSSINADIGVITAGQVNGAALAIDFNVASGHNAVLSHNAFTLWADGEGDFSGTVSASLFTAPTANFGDLVVGGAYGAVGDVPPSAATISFAAASDGGFLAFSSIGTITQTGSYSSRFSLSTLLESDLYGGVEATVLYLPDGLVHVGAAGTGPNGTTDKMLYIA